MKLIVLIILVILSASCSSSKGPAVTVKERRNIQAYLSDRHAPSEVQIIRIDALDSVFTPFNDLISLKYRKARINRDAWEICKNAAFLADNRARKDSINRARFKTAMLLIFCNVAVFLLLFLSTQRQSD